MRRSVYDGVWGYIKKLINSIVILNLLFCAYPTKIKAEVSIPKPQDNGSLIRNDVIIKPNIPTTEEEVESVRKYNEQQRVVAAASRVTATRQPTPAPSKKASVAVNKKKYGRLECVRFVKDLLGIYGSWGNGARKLSHNSTGQVGDVAIFRRYVHAAYVIGRTGNQVTIREWITLRRGAFEQTRTLSVSEFSGFHKF